MKHTIEGHGVPLLSRAMDAYVAQLLKKAAAIDRKADVDARIARRPVTKAIPQSLLAELREAQSAAAQIKAMLEREGGRA